jgi:nucleosome binding factor SPN SPT16 subunit
MEFRDSTYLLSPKNGRQLKANMVFCVSLGFQDLEDQDHKRYFIIPLLVGRANAPTDTLCKSTTP